MTKDQASPWPVLSSSARKPQRVQGRAHSPQGLLRWAVRAAGAEPASDPGSRLFHYDQRNLELMFLVLIHLSSAIP